MRKFDLHTHTRYSDGTAGVREMVEAAETRKLEAIAITDHGPDTHVGVPPWAMKDLMKDIEEARGEAGIPVLAGIEANVVDGSGNIDIDEETVKRLDVVIFSIHKMGHLIDPEESAVEYVARMSRAIRRGGAMIIGHPLFYHQELSSYLKKEELEEFARTIAECGVAVELNMRYRVPDDEFLRLCAREGVKFSIGSDAHRPSEVGAIDWALSKLNRIGIKDEDVILHEILG